MRRLAIVMAVLFTFASVRAVAQQPPAATAPAPPKATVARPSDKGLTPPKVVKEVKPQYTPAAMKARVQGPVVLECVVNADGTVGDVTVLKSLDAQFGLDDEAVKAAKQWRFKPGLKKGKPVPVALTLELTFTLRDGPPAKK